MERDSGKIGFVDVVGVFAIFGVVWTVAFGIFSYLKPPAIATSPKAGRLKLLGETGTSNPKNTDGHDAEVKHQRALGLIAKNLYQEAKPLLFDLTSLAAYKRNAWRDYCNCCEGIYDREKKSGVPPDPTNKAEWQNGLHHFKDCLDPRREPNIYAVVVSSLEHLASESNE